MTSYSPEVLEQFRQVQQLAYRCVTAIEQQLTVGMTERHVARMMRNWLSDHDVREYFHTPFVWFGDRTSFTGFRTPLSFAPTKRRLQAGAPVILDVGPAIDGVASDIGYSCCVGHNPTLEKMQDDLEAYREMIPELVAQGCTARQVYREVNRLIAEQGYENRHHVYPFGVLAHKVFRMEPGMLQRVEVGGFGLRAVRGLRNAALQARRGVEHVWPLWNDHDMSDVPISHGLWAVEPHLGLGPIGAKWEELLVVDDSGARWLDDDLPHVRRWEARRAAAA